MVDRVLDRATIEEARRAFPGAAHPCPRKKPEEYAHWYKRMTLWAFVYGTILLAAAEAEHGVERAA